MGRRHDPAAGRPARVRPLPAWVTGPTIATREERGGQRVTCETCGATAWFRSPDFVRMWIEVHPNDCRGRP